jgi:carboxylesterase type B
MIGGVAPTGLLESLGSSGIDIGTRASGAKETAEDCLFLDVLVPSKALKGEVKLPIINWIYGGAYLLGSKEGMYEGNTVPSFP